MEPCDICKLQDWLRNYHLANTDAFSLFNEFLEMGESTPLDLLRGLTKSSPLRVQQHGRRGDRPGFTLSLLQ